MVPHGLRWSSKFTVTVTTSISRCCPLYNSPSVFCVCVCVCICVSVCVWFLLVYDLNKTVTFALPSGLLCSRATSSLGFLHSVFWATISYLLPHFGFVFILTHFCSNFAAGLDWFVEFVDWTCRYITFGRKERCPIGFLFFIHFLWRVQTRKY